jgi:hypothetical protein
LHLVGQRKPELNEEDKSREMEWGVLAAMAERRDMFADRIANSVLNSRK